MRSHPFITPVSSKSNLQIATKSSLQFVEVQEVFDQEDLNSQWNETFVPKKCLVWVPNKRKRPTEKMKEETNHR